ncbi:MAG: transporter [Bryobacterales bacterium]|nr:transporter [Bryobacterales bacterium]
MVRIWLGTCVLGAAAVAWGGDGEAAVRTPVALLEGEPELGELISDRPDFTESSEVVGKGVLQIETGIAGERYGRGADGTGGITGPMPLVRLGVSKRFEFRFSGDGYSRQRLLARGSEATGGASDGGIGGKVKLVDEKGARPALAVIAGVSAPVGHNRFTSGGWDPEVKLCWAKEVPAGFAVSGNFNFSSVTDSDGRLWNRAVSLSAGHDLAFGLAGYFEWYDLSYDRGQGHGSLVNGGITRGIGKNAQVDVEVGHTISGNSPGWFASIGFVVRRPIQFLMH